MSNEAVVLLSMGEELALFAGLIGAAIGCALGGGVLAVILNLPRRNP